MPGRGCPSSGLSSSEARSGPLGPRHPASHRVSAAAPAGVAFGVVGGLVLVGRLGVLAPAEGVARDVVASTGVQADAAGNPVALNVVGDLVLVGRLGVLASAEAVAFGVVGVPFAAVVAGRLVLRDLVAVAQDLVGGALLAAGHASSFLPGRSRMDRLWLLPAAESSPTRALPAVKHPTRWVFTSRHVFRAVRRVRPARPGIGDSRGSGVPRHRHL